MGKELLKSKHDNRKKKRTVWKRNIDVSEMDPHLEVEGRDISMHVKRERGGGGEVENLVVVPKLGRPKLGRPKLGRPELEGPELRRTEFGGFQKNVDIVPNK